MADEVFTKERLAGGRIVCYRFVSTGSEAAEKWYTEITDLFMNWDASAPLFLLVDLRQAENLISPEMLRTAREASQERPDVPGKTALIIDSSEPAQNVTGMVDHVLAETRERKIFDNEPDAINWLLHG